MPARNLADQLLLAADRHLSSYRLLSTSDLHKRKNYFGKKKKNSKPRRCRSVVELRLLISPFNPACRGFFGLLKRGGNGPLFLLFGLRRVRGGKEGG